VILRRRSDICVENVMLTTMILRRGVPQAQARVNAAARTTTIRYKPEREPYEWQAMAGSSRERKNQDPGARLLVRNAAVNQ